MLHLKADFCSIESIYPVAAQPEVKYNSHRVAIAESGLSIRVARSISIIEKILAALLGLSQRLQEIKTAGGARRSDN